MKLAKSILLGSAIGLIGVAGAQAADLPSRKSAPVQYVRICDALRRRLLLHPGHGYLPQDRRLGRRRSPHASMRGLASLILLLTAQIGLRYPEPLLVGLRAFGYTQARARDTYGYAALRAYRTRCAHCVRPGERSAPSSASTPIYGGGTTAATGSSSFIAGSHRRCDPTSSRSTSRYSTTLLNKAFIQFGWSDGRLRPVDVRLLRRRLQL